MPHIKIDPKEKKRVEPNGRTVEENRKIARGAGKGATDEADNK